MLYRLLTQQKEDREKEGVSADKDQAVYKTLTDMRNMMADMKEERLKLQVMMVQTKGGKRKGKTSIVEEVSSSNSKEEDEKEVEPTRKLTKAERKVVNQIRGGQGTSKKQRKNNGGGGQGSNQEQAAQTLPEQPQPQAGGRGRGRGRGQGTGGGRGNGGGQGNWQNWFCKYCGQDGHGIRDDQGGLTDVTASQSESSSAKRMMATTIFSHPAFKRPTTASLPQARRARKPPRPRATPKEGPSQPRKIETIPIEKDDGEEDELLRAEDERQTKQWAMEREPETGKADV
ncbi:hypothetical protein CBR_g85448, partial [Chara braunii]